MLDFFFKALNELELGVWSWINDIVVTQHSQKLGYSKRAWIEIWSEIIAKSYNLRRSESIGHGNLILKNVSPCLDQQPPCHVISGISHAIHDVILIHNRRLLPYCIQLPCHLEIPKRWVDFTFNVTFMLKLTKRMMHGNRKNKRSFRTILIF